MKSQTQHQIRIHGRRVEYRVVRSLAARRLRLRVGPSGVEVVQPAARNGKDVSAFVGRHGEWILDQLSRARRLSGLHRPAERRGGEILYRGEPIRLSIETTNSRLRGNVVEMENGGIVIQCGIGSRTPAARSLEAWLRKQARLEIEKLMTSVAARVRQRPERVYIMGQRTKWGNCSSRRNLSFNWRLILAPSFVMKYMVTHEAVHLAVPDHSAKFWLMVQSICPDMERAKQWLCRNHLKISVDLASAVSS